jgi:hypothetical protein
MKTIGQLGNKHHLDNMVTASLLAASGIFNIRNQDYEYPLGDLARQAGIRLQPDRPLFRCMLPTCQNMTKHRGGYCSPNHCKEHRQTMKALNHEGTQV